MRFVARARYVRFSPYKLRPLADVIRGKSVSDALRWLEGTALKRTAPLLKTVASAVANAKDRAQIDSKLLRVSEIRVDEGPRIRYFKAGAMGRSNVYRKRLSHVSVVVEQIAK